MHDRERLAEGSRRIEAGSDRQGDRPAGEATAKRRRLSTVYQLGWVTGAKVLDANGMEHTIQAMQHRYVQCSWLSLLLSVSDGEESCSSMSEKDGKNSLSDDASDWEDGPEDAGLAAEGPGQDSADEL